MKFKNSFDRLKAWYDIEYHNICPRCKEKEMWLDEDGMEHQGYVCKSCGLGVSVLMERVAESVTLYDEETDQEILLFDHSTDNHN